MTLESLLQTLEATYPTFALNHGAGTPHWDVVLHKWSENPNFLFLTSRGNGHTIESAIESAIAAEPIHTVMKSRKGDEGTEVKADRIPLGQLLGLKQEPIRRRV